MSDHADHNFWEATRTSALDATREYFQPLTWLKPLFERYKASRIAEMPRSNAAADEAIKSGHEAPRESFSVDKREEANAVDVALEGLNVEEFVISRRPNYPRTVERREDEAALTGHP